MQRIIYKDELALDHSDNELPALDHSDNDDDDSFYRVDEFCESSKNPCFLRQSQQLGAFYWGILAKSLKIIESALLTVNCNG